MHRSHFAIYIVPHSIQSLHSPHHYSICTSQRPWRGPSGIQQWMFEISIKHSACIIFVIMFNYVQQRVWYICKICIAFLLLLLYIRTVDNSRDSSLGYNLRIMIATTLHPNAKLQLGNWRSLITKLASKHKYISRFAGVEWSPYTLMSLFREWGASLRHCDRSSEVALDNLRSWAK